MMTLLWLVDAPPIRSAKSKRFLLSYSRRILCDKSSIYFFSFEASAPAKSPHPYYHRIADLVQLFFFLLSMLFKHLLVVPVLIEGYHERGSEKQSIEVESGNDRVPYDVSSFDGSGWFEVCPEPDGPFGFVELEDILVFGGGGHGGLYKVNMVCFAISD